MLTLKIISPENIIFDGIVESVFVPGTLGQFEILKDHAPIISTLEKGVVCYVTDKEKKSVSIEGGFVSVQKNVVKVCVEI